MDIVEANPYCDSMERTAQTAIRLVDMLGAAPHRGCTPSRRASFRIFDDEDRNFAFRLAALVAYCSELVLLHA